MKHLTRTFALLLSVVMIFAMATTAFAAESGSITVDNPQAGQTYTAYKIFDVTYNEDKSAYSYTISGTSEWFDVIATKTENGANSKIDGLKFTKAVASDTYVVTTEAGFSAAEFANALKAAVAEKQGTELSTVGDKAVASNLSLGYYFVASSSGALCNLTTTNPNATIHDKNDVPFDKVDDKVSADVGETVNYTITGKVPDTTGFTTYTYEIADKMSDGLTFNKDIVVKIGNDTLSAGNEYTVEYDVDGNANSFKVNIDVMKQTANVGKSITLTYSAVVNENAVAKIEKNSATLTYSNDPTKNTTTTTQPDEETVYTSKIVLDKYKAGSEETKLAGATFVLYKEVDKDGSGISKLYYKYNDANQKVEWVANAEEATTKTTDENGFASFDGLANGTYYLEETVAPAGYNLLDAPVKIDVNGGTTEAQLTTTAKVENNTGIELPSTGGVGTTIFYVLGGTLLLVAIVLLVTKRRMRRYR